MFLGVLINYLDRVNISHTILVISRDLHLSPTQQGVILSAFSWGYVLFMLPGGRLVDRFGARSVNALSCAAWSLFTGLIGASNGFVSLVVLRIFLGSAEAPIFPGNAKVVRLWFPIEERGRATALFDVGSYVGASIAAPLVVFTMLRFGWRAAFLACSIFGLVWSIVWYAYYKSPDELGSSQRQRSLTKKERSSQLSTQSRLNWLPLFSNKTVLGMSFGFFCYNYLKSFFLTWFPSYLVSERGFTFIKVGIFSLIPPLCAVFGELLAGIGTDMMIKRGVSITLARKLPLCIGLLLSTVVIGTAFVNSQVWVIVLLSLSYASLISASASIWAIPGDVAPSTDLVGSIGGIQNTFSNCAGIVAPIVTGFLYSITGSFLLPLTISALLCVLGALSYWFIVGDLSPITLRESWDG